MKSHLIVPVTLLCINCRPTEASEADLELTLLCSLINHHIHQTALHPQPPPPPQDRNSHRKTDLMSQKDFSTHNASQHKYLLIMYKCQRHWWEDIQKLKP